MKKLLILIPMYNARQFIVECLTSIISQNIPMRIIVIDDASTDGRSSLISQFKQVELLRNDQNMGTYYSINLGLEHALIDSSWTHYCIHGADDISLSSRFIKQLSSFTPNTLAVGCGFNRVDFISKKIVSSNTKTNESVLLFSRKVIDLIGYYDVARVGCDTEYKRRLLLSQPNSIRQLNEILIRSYLHTDNLTKKIPLGGIIRKEYVNSFTKKHEEMKKKQNFYLPFTQN